MSTILHQLTEKDFKFKPRFKRGDLVKYTCKLFRTAPEWERIKDLVGVVINPTPDKDNLIHVAFKDYTVQTLQTYLSLMYEEEEKK